MYKFQFNVFQVNGLKRLVRKTLASSIRQVMRKLFSDELLKHYSYVGQKKKKIFSTLSSCAIIFGKIKKFYILKVLNHIFLYRYSSVK